MGYRPALAPVEVDPLADAALDAALDEEREGEPQYYVEGVHQALREEMGRDPTVVLMGQDIGPFEGAFRITKGLWAQWPDRVRDTPIAESGTLGIAAGAALLGYKPVIEMQFGDFISCGFNQVVNVLAKLFYSWQTPCPVVIRLPAGGGVGAGPFHSQNPEAWFAHVAGLKVVCPATAEDAKVLLKAAIRDPNPVIFCEHKYLYRRIKTVLPSPTRCPPSAAPKCEGKAATSPSWAGEPPSGPAWTPPTSSKRRATAARWSTCAPWCRSTKPPCSPRSRKPAER